MNKEQKIKEIGYIEKGTGKHQSNIVYESGGYHQLYALV
jgi:hypothetical protein